MSRATLTPIIALLGALVLATVLDHARVQRAIGFIGAVVGVIVLVVTLLFTVDAIQMSGVVRPEGKKALVFAATEALVKFMLFTTALFILARAALKSTSRRGASPKGQKDVLLVNRMPAT
jgi:formate hydrogenlyase subunit 3/multisubunit Na+/H+ antiporter MnhD subunit